MAARKDFDAALLALAQQHLPRAVWLPYMQSGEAATIAYFVAMAAGSAGLCVCKEDGLPDFSFVEFEFPLMKGRADVVVFHQDGGATVIEAKDGMAGRRSVLGGIGQVVSYAYQLGASRAAPKYVQKMLLWSPCSSVDDDLHIIDVCASAGVLHSISAKVSDLHKESEALMRRLLSDVGVMGHGVE